MTPKEIGKYEIPQRIKTIKGKLFVRYNIIPLTKEEAILVKSAIKRTFPEVLVRVIAKNVLIVAANEFKLWYYVYTCNR